jgi:hypothetical protein
MNRNFYSTYSVNSSTYNDGLRSCILNTYGYMTIGLTLTAATIFVVSSSPFLFNLFFSTFLRFVFIGLPLLMILYYNNAEEKLGSFGVKTFFWLFCVVMGISLSYIPHVYDGESLFYAALLTACTFAIMSIYGRFTKVDLSSIKFFMIVGLFGVIISSVINLFINSEIVNFTISIITVVIFLVLTSIDIQELIKRYNSHYDSDHSTNSELITKISIRSATSLYLNFINLFLSILRIMGNRR